MNYLVQVSEHDHVDFYRLSYDDAVKLLSFKDSSERWKYFREVAIPDPNVTHWGFTKDKADLYWNASWEWTDIDVEEWQKVLNKIVKL